MRGHEVGKSVSERVELVVDRLVASALRVLKERDKQERDDRRQRVDDQLPRVQVAEDDIARKPDDDEQRAAARLTQAPAKLGQTFVAHSPTVTTPPATGWRSFDTPCAPNGPPRFMPSRTQ